MMIELQLRNPELKVIKKVFLIQGHQKRREVNINHFLFGFGKIPIHDIGSFVQAIKKSGVVGHDGTVIEFIIH